MREGMESTETVGFREQHARARATPPMPTLQPPGTSPAIPATSRLLSLQFPLEQSLWLLQSLLSKIELTESTAWLFGV